MDKKLKLFVACCAIALATVAATTDVKASPATTQDQSLSTSPDLSAGGGCYGKGTCGVTKNGTVLVGKWREL